MRCPIRTENVSKSYRDVAALTGLNLEVPENGIYGLIGPNGAGKTTTIKVLMNIMRAASGRAEVLGVDSTRLSSREFASIGYVSEDQALPGWMSVEYLLSYLRPFYPTWDDRRAAELVYDLGLPLSRKIDQLSRGTRMKMALACALAYRPKLLVLDEPFAGLDPLVRDELTSGVLSAAEHATMLISSHDLADIETFVSHVGYLDHGRLHFSEDMSSLAGRFREIEIVTDGEAASPRVFPKSWVNLQRCDNCLRWVDTQFEQDRSMAEIRRVFGEPLQVSMKPMPLRSVFITLARASRSGA